MKFKIEKEILIENLNYVSKAVSNRNIIPVLNGIEFNLTKKGLSLTATNNDITIKTFIDKKNIKEIINEGKVIIYGRYLLDIVRKLPENELLIEEIDGNKTVITTTNSNYNFNCYSVEEFPKIDIKESNIKLKLTSGVFREILNQTSFATSMQESRPLLTGINIKIIGDLLECVATDSYRLAKKVIKLDIPVEENINVVIPAKNINELVKVIENDDEEVELHIFSNKILFKYKNILFQSSLLNGTYPNTDSFVPNNFELEIEVSLSELFGMIDRASLLTQAKEKNNIQLSIDSDKLLINSSSMEIGKVEEKMKVNKIKGDNIKISFSAKYMMDALKTFNTKTVKLYFNGQIKPIIIKENDSGSLIQLILPIMTY